MSILSIGRTPRAFQNTCTVKSCVDFVVTCRILLCIWILNTSAILTSFNFLSPDFSWSILLRCKFFRPDRLSVQPRRPLQICLGGSGSCNQVCCSAISLHERSSHGRISSLRNLLLFWRSQDPSLWQRPRIRESGDSRIEDALAGTRFSKRKASSPSIPRQRRTSQRRHHKNDLGLDERQQEQALVGRTSPRTVS